MFDPETLAVACDDRNARTPVPFDPLVDCDGAELQVPSLRQDSVHYYQSCCAVLSARDCYGYPLPALQLDLPPQFVLHSLLHEFAEMRRAEGISAVTDED